MSTPPRRTIMLSHPRLHTIVNTQPDLCATITEYAQQSGLPSERVLAVFEEPLNAAIFTVEAVGSEIFINTNGPNNHSSTPPNLWSTLRVDTPPETAYLLWRQIRGLQRAGWTVITNPTHINAAIRPLAPPIKIAVNVNNTTAPVLLHPDPQTVTNPTGPAAAVADAGATIAAIIIESGTLDGYVTALKQLGRQRPAITTTYLLCEAPRYNPVTVTVTGHSVAPRAKTLFDITAPAAGS